MSWRTFESVGICVEEDGWLLTISEFSAKVTAKSLMDHDGFGFPVYGDLIDTSIFVNPSDFQECVPKETTHVHWYARELTH